MSDKIKEELKSEIDELLGRYQKKREIHEETHKMSGVNEDFVARFTQHANKVIRPALSTLGAYLKSKGAKYEITPETILVGGKDSKIESITMKVFPSPDTSSDIAPRVSFSVVKPENKVMLVRRIGVNQGTELLESSKIYELEDITSDLIHQKVLKTMKEFMKLRE